MGLGAALDYVERIGLENIGRYEHELLAYAMRGLETIPGLRLIGTAPDKAGVLSFVLQGFRSEEVGQALNREGIAVRSGHHCAQPILRRFGQESTVRPSLAFYNTCEEIDALVAALRRIQGGALRAVALRCFLAGGICIHAMHCAIARTYTRQGRTACQAVDLAGREAG